MNFERFNPMTGAVASVAPAMTAEQMPAIVARAAAAQPAWNNTGPSARRAILMAAADALERRRGEFVAAMAAEIGATAGWANFNVTLAAAHGREAASIVTQIAGEVIPSDKPGLLSMAMREPVGVVLGIAPWNAPIILGVRAIAVPLACGNGVVFKASEQCPRTHGLIVEAFAEAGLPEGLVQLVTNAPADAAEVVGALVDAPAIRRINFTGSTAVGKIIARRAADTLKPCLLELGGKAPLIVCRDADLDEAVEAAAFGAYMNQGQICMSTERIIVVDAVADAFVEKLTAKVATLVVGDPARDTTPLGAVVDAGTVDRCHALICDALEKGAALKAGGSVTSKVLMPAHLLDHVTPAMDLFHDESFGPVAGVIRARDEDHAVELANCGEYGLSSAVFTRDVGLGLRLARQIRAGICHINGPTVHDEPQMPFGGMGASGYGRFGGHWGIDSFTETRWITVATEPGRFPI